MDAMRDHLISIVYGAAMAVVVFTPVLVYALVWGKP